MQWWFANAIQGRRRPDAVSVQRPQAPTLSDSQSAGDSLFPRNLPHLPVSPCLLRYALALFIDLVYCIS